MLFTQGHTGFIRVGNPFSKVVSFVCTVHGYTCTATHDHPAHKVVSYDVCTGRLPPPGGFHQIFIRWHAQCKARVRFASGCTSLHRLNTLIQIECGKHQRCAVGTRPDLIVLELCLIVDTSSFFSRNSRFCDCGFHRTPNFPTFIHLSTPAGTSTRKSAVL